MRRLLPLLLLAACSPVRPPPASPEVAPDTAFVLINPRTVSPSPIHVAASDMVRQCAGPGLRMPMALVLADSIIGLPSGRLYYGYTTQARNAAGDTLAILAIEAAFEHNPEPFSHEYLHALYGAAESDAYMRHCTLRSGVVLPARITDDPQWHARRRGAVILGGHRR